MDVALVFPHQLFRPHPAVEKIHSVILFEDPLFFGPDEEWPTRMHRQKLVLHRASLRFFAGELHEAGHAVKYLPCPGKGGRTESLLAGALPRTTRRIHVVDLVDDVLSQRVRALAETHRCELVVHETPLFLTPHAELNAFFADAHKPRMARFYEQQRKRLGLLLEKGGTPTGGKWSFDTENRRKFPRRQHPPNPLRSPANTLTEESRKEIEREFPTARGSADSFAYPSTPAEASNWLNDFLAGRLAAFGTYEDAISVRHPVLFHSVLTPCLNIGLITPAEIIKRTLHWANHHKVPLNSLEGFVRQIVGWREYMRGMYEKEGRRMRTSNFWGFRRRIPHSFYEGTTGIEPVDHVIQRILRSGYCHHIERLMVLGNFFLLCRIHPDDVYRWFMEMFIDSYDWVMVPNVYGMSQFADGGRFTTKPYLSGSNYLRKMSDFPPGPWCETWDALFWTFIEDYREVFAANPRLHMIVQTCDRLGAKQKEHRETAEKFLQRL